MNESAFIGFIISYFVGSLLVFAYTEENYREGDMPVLYGLTWPISIFYLWVRRGE